MTCSVATTISSYVAGIIQNSDEGLEEELEFALLGLALILIQLDCLFKVVAFLEAPLYRLDLVSAPALLSCLVACDCRDKN